MTATPSTCAHTDHLIEQAALGLLSPTDQQRLDQRLAECPVCRARLAEYQALAAAMALLAEPAGDTTGDMSYALPPTVVRPHDDIVSTSQHANRQPHAPAQRRRRREGWYVAAALLLLASMTALIFKTFVVGRPVATHPLATPTAGRPTATPQPLALPPDTMLADLSLLSPNEGWAVGDIVPGAPAAPRSTTVFLHLAGGSWTLTDQRFPGVHVETISMASADEGWAGGDKSNAEHTGLVGVMLHFSHGRWSEVAVPNTGNISKVQMLSADEGWALATRPLADATCPQDAATCSGGSGGGNAGPSDHFSGILHYQHGVWSPVTFPASFPSPFWLDWHAGVVDLSMASPDDGWAVCQGLLVHYSHGEWQYRGMLDGLGATSRIAMISPTDGWIGGPTESVSNLRDPATPPSVSVPAAYHYDGTAWRPATLPAGLGGQGGAALLRFQPGPAGSVYLLAGAFFPGKTSPTTVLRYVGGTWQTVPFPGDLFITAIDDGWALGWVQGQPSWVSSILYERPSGEWAAYPVTR